MRLTSSIALSLFLCACAAAEDLFYRAFQTFSARYHCDGQWTDFQLTMSPVADPLGVVDTAAGVTAVLKFNFPRSITSIGQATYRLAGPYDSQDRALPSRAEGMGWSHPASLEMLGIEGTFDAQTRKTTAKMLSSKCDAVEMAAYGVTLPPLPPQAAAPGSDPNREERFDRPSGVSKALVTEGSEPAGRNNE